MANIKINNNSYIGNSVTIVNGVITVDGKNYTPNDKVITITVEGNINSLSADACNTITVNGEVDTIKTMSGDVHCANVTGNIKTMSGDVHCLDIEGDVTTMSGDIKKR